MLRSFLSLITVALLLGSASCSRRARLSGDRPATDKPVIGVSVLTLANPFFKVMADAMQTEGKNYGYEVIITSADMDPALQKDQVKDFITRKVAAIVLCPADSRSIGTAIKEANEGGIPVFTADIACLDKSAKVVSHIATDNYSGGKLAGEALADLIGGRGTVAIIDHPEVESVILRTRGFREAIATRSGITIIAQLPGGGMRDTAFKTAQDILEKYPDLDGIFAINDPSALGAVAALEKAGRVGRVKVVGFDGQPEAKRAIRDGKMHADSIQYPDKIGKLAIETVARYFAGETVPPETLIPTGLYGRTEAENDPELK